MRLKKERRELVPVEHLRRCFLRNLTAKSFIVDIRPGSKYPTDERKKLFTFSIKATLKATTLDICMCSAELLLSKNQKGLAHYPRTLCKRNSTADIFL